MSNCPTGAPGYVTSTFLNGMSFVEGWEQNFFISKWSMHQLVWFHFSWHFELHFCWGFPLLFVLLGYIGLLLYQILSVIFCLESLYHTSLYLNLFIVIFFLGVFFFHLSMTMVQLVFNLKCMNGLGICVLTVMLRITRWEVQLNFCTNTLRLVVFVQFQVSKVLQLASHKAYGWNNGEVFIIWVES